MIGLVYFLFFVVVLVTYLRYKDMDNRARNIAKTHYKIYKLINKLGYSSRVLYVIYEHNHDYIKVMIDKDMLELFHSRNVLDTECLMDELNINLHYRIKLTLEDSNGKIIKTYTI